MGTQEVHIHFKAFFVQNKLPFTNLLIDTGLISLFDRQLRCLPGNHPVLQAEGGITFSSQFTDRRDAAMASGANADYFPASWYLINASA